MGWNRRVTRARALAVALAVVVGSSMGAGAASAQSGGEPMMLPENSASQAPQQTLPGDSYVAEVVDSTFFVGPAEFFALDLPTSGAGIVATHLSGTVAVAGKGDILVRLFAGAEYDRWLKKRGGPEAKPFWVSPKSRSINLDRDLPAGQPVVLLLDNGYSIRTPKRVHCQLQIQYRRVGAGAAPRVSADSKGGKSGTPKSDDVVPTPRSNEEEDTPPPPPPPPPDDSGN
ncbi:MAG TPA: hypothetical protein VFS09_02995 [Candidatus Eisenbacteria bacterium]|nr:hypothetical protein [Candidatus Eisenbacteria bacterium]